MDNQRVNKELHNILVKYAKELAKEVANPSLPYKENRVVASAFHDIKHLSSDPTYQKRVKSAFKESHFTPAEQVKKTLRHNIVSELGTKHESYAQSDVEDLMYLDEEPPKTYANTMDIEDPPEFSDVERLVGMISKWN